MKTTIKKLSGFFRDWDRQSTYFKWMIAQTKPYIRSIILILTLNLIITISGIGSTVVTKYIIDGATGSGPAFTIQGVALLILLTVVGIGISAAISILSSYISERYAFGIRTKVYDNILRGVWQKIVSYHSGDILTRLTSDIERVANGIATIIPNIFLLLFQLVIAFSVLFHYDHFLALAALLIGPVGVLFSLAFGGRLKKYQVELNKIESEYRSFIQETVENIAVTKTFEMEPLYNKKLISFRDRRLGIIMKRNKLNAAMSLCIRSVFGAGYLIAFCWGIYKLSTGGITYGTMTIFLSLVAQVQGPIINLGGIIPQFITVLASTGRVMEIDAIESEKRVEPKIRGEMQKIGFKIEDADLGYGRDSVLKEVNLDIRPGDVVGVVGVSGSGKTTLVRLILSLVQTQKGRLLFANGSGTGEEGSAAARRFISYVPQGNTLISGTVAENLKAGKDDATEEEIWQALRIADCDSFVCGLENGLYTGIGENALGLSEGQAQRIAIARAILKAAPILILDEATSALDAGTEERVIRRMCKSQLLHTCFIITHRRSMLEYCTRALEIKNGTVEELKL